MKGLHICWIAGLVLCLHSLSTWAATAYVTDSFEITLRTGPSTENRIVRMLSSGEALEILETREDWTRVQLKGAGEEPTEGWVLNRYLIHRRPWEAQVEALSRENTALKNKLGAIEKRLEASTAQNQEFERQYRESSETLGQVQADFESLKKESSQFLELRDKYEAAQAELQAARDGLEKISMENKALRSSQNTKWFLAGALVFLSALLMGLAFGKREKKRRGGLSHWSP